MTALEWLVSKRDHASEACLIWPFGRTHRGYGKVYVAGKTVGAHRHMCCIANGPPPPGKKEAAHSCGNPLCVNPRHLRWASGSENCADKIRHGRMPFGSRHSNAKLSEDQAVRIIREAKIMRQKELAAKYGVTPQTIWKLLRGKTWAHLNVN